MKVAVYAERKGLGGWHRLWRSRHQGQQAGPARVQPMLRNELYVGRVVWNRREWVCNPATGKRVYKRRAESEWIRTEAPELRIVDDELWQAVQARRDELQSAHDGRKRTRGLNTRPGKAPVYLFSAIVKCGVCDGDYIKANATTTAATPTSTRALPLAPIASPCARTRWRRSCCTPSRRNHRGQLRGVQDGSTAGSRGTAQAPEQGREPAAEAAGEGRA